MGAAYCPTIYVGDGVKGIYGAWMMYVFWGDRAIVRAGRAYGLQAHSTLIIKRRVEIVFV